MRAGAVAVALAVLAGACADEPRPASSHATGLGSTPPTVLADIVIPTDQESVALPARLLGTNVPAWLGPGMLGDATFQAETRATGTTLLRMPGGSWSNSYEWDACETGDATRCWWPDAARPTDFIGFLRAVGVEGMWTLSANSTAQSAAAAVAFFNGAVDDSRVIGVDRNGVDWMTVDHWARLRADNGNPDPVGIQLWEFGNEVYAGKPGSGGEQCAGFGWEDVWTCDGTEYTVGTVDHDGYLAIRAAMQLVDPAVVVGAVGIGEPGEWSNWGNEVIAAAGPALDFYVVHQYGFDTSPSADAATARARQLWAPIMGTVRIALGEEIPVAVTEFNLVSVGDNDTEQTMTQVMNALYIADSIGQLAHNGVTIANHWNLANGRAANGTDYGLISAEDGTRFPQFEGFAVWSRMGEALLPPMSIEDRLTVYPSRHADGHWTILVINGSDRDVETTLSLAGPESVVGSADVRGVWAADPSASAFEAIAPVAVMAEEGRLPLVLGPFSLTTIDIPAPA